MNKYKLKKYLNIIPIILLFLIFSCLYTYWYLYNFLNSNHAVKLSEKEIFLNLAGDGGNFTSSSNIVVFFLIIFVLFLFYIFPSDNSSVLIRLKSRNAYVTRRIVDCAVFAFIFTVLIEAVSVVVALINFNINVILYFNFIQYSLLEILTLFLFYFRAGLVLLAFEIIASKKVAPFIAIALYLIECLSYRSLMLSKVWFPFRDALVVSTLMTGEMQTSYIFGIVLRALIMSLLLIVPAYFLYKKKDVLSNAKKK